MVTPAHRAEGQHARPAGVMSVETACGTAARSGSSVRRVTLSSSDVAAIRGAEEALADAFEASDPTAWVDFYTEDAIFVGPGMPALEGRDRSLKPHLRS